VSLSGDGNVVAIGAPFYSGVASTAGRARVYRYESFVGWQQVGADITGDNEGDLAVRLLIRNNK
jgi:hypothetical protein